MLPSLPSLSDHEREVLRLLQTPWGEAGAALEHEVLSRLGPADEEALPGPGDLLGEGAR
ncbi:MAG TPA: hypothetical protein VFG18_04555 [Xanthomonadaceae bacterium]|jgi:hypothetical protein|nr:hypothetical protein [Xanthomonadaceae bacterium]HVI25326.1 hypothetical protein [Xanthomonadaceae bacterium]